MSKLTTVNELALRYEEMGFVDFIKCLDNLTEREKTVLIRGDFKLETHAAIAKDLKVQPARVSQIIGKARRRMGFSIRNYTIIRKRFDDIEASNRLLELKLQRAEALLVEHGKPIPTTQEIDGTTVEDMDISVRLYNVLKIHKINLLGEIKDVGNECLKWRDFGRKTYIELREIMEEYGINWPVTDPQLH